MGDDLPPVTCDARRVHHGGRPPARQRRQVLARRRPITRRHAGPPASGVEVAVADEGVGMTPEQVGALLRALLAGRGHRRPPVRRHRHRPLHRAVARRGHGRHDRGDERGRASGSCSGSASTACRPTPPTTPRRAAEDAGLGQTSMIREYMRQLGCRSARRRRPEVHEHDASSAAQRRRSAPCTPATG